MATSSHKLDKRAALHAGQSSITAPDLRRAGMFSKPSLPLKVNGPVIEPAERLARAHAAGEITLDRKLDLMASVHGTRRVDLTQDPPDPTLGDLLPANYCLRHGLMPWAFADGQIVFVTDRPDRFAARLPQLQVRIGALARVSSRPVIAARTDIQTMIAARHRDRLTASMSERVPEFDSCRSWSASPVQRMLLLSIFLIAGGLALAWYPTVTLFAFTTCATITLFIAMVMKGAAAVATLTAPAPPPAEPLTRRNRDALPSVSVLVPLYKEHDIARSLIGHLERLDYPREKLEILLIMEEEDDVTRNSIADLTLPFWIRPVLVPDGAPRTKPRAMNYALDFCDGEIVGIYDAEDAPDPDQLLKVAHRFQEAPDKVACLQGALDYYNPRQTWLARCFTVEYNTWFRLMMPGMARLGFALPLGGTTCFFRREALDHVGAWDAHNVTEDADLGFRLARHGYSTEMIDTTTREEAACHFVPWIKQRSRWLKGYLVTYFVHMRSPRRLYRELGPWRFIGFNAHFITALSAFILAPFLLSFWLFLLGFHHPLEAFLPHELLVLLTAMFLLAELQNITLGVAATLREQHRFLWPYVPTMHVYFPLGCLAAYKALYELIKRPFYWDKTSHGHSLPHPDKVEPVIPRPPRNRASAA